MAGRRSWAPVISAKPDTTAFMAAGMVCTHLHLCTFLWEVRRQSASDDGVNNSG